MTFFACESWKMSTFSVCLADCHGFSSLLWVVTRIVPFSGRSVWAPMRDGKLSLPHGNTSLWKTWPFCVEVTKNGHLFAPACLFYRKPRHWKHPKMYILPTRTVSHDPILGLACRWPALAYFGLVIMMMVVMMMPVMMVVIMMMMMVVMTTMGLSGEIPATGSPAHRKTILTALSRTLLRLDLYVDEDDRIWLDIINLHCGRQVHCSRQGQQGGQDQGGGWHDP